LTLFRKDASRIDPQDSLDSSCKRKGDLGLFRMLTGLTGHGRCCGDHWRGHLTSLGVKRRGDDNLLGKDWVELIILGYGRWN